MFIYVSCYFDIDQGHSDRFKWCIVQTQARSEMGYRFSGSGLKRGMKNNIFWFEIGSGFWEPWGTPRPKILGSTLAGVKPRNRLSHESACSVKCSTKLWINYYTEKLLPLDRRHRYSWFYHWPKLRSKTLVYNCKFCAEVELVCGELTDKLFTVLGK